MLSSWFRQPNCVLLQPNFGHLAKPREVFRYVPQQFTFKLHFPGRVNERKLFGLKILILQNHIDDSLTVEFSFGVLLQENILVDQLVDFEGSLIVFPNTLEDQVNIVGFTSSQHIFNVAAQLALLCIEDQLLLQK